MVLDSIKINEVKAQQIIRKACDKFNCYTIPVVEFKRARKNVAGCYGMESKTIEIYGTKWRTVETILHEVAHHITCNEVDEHGPEFHNTLEDLRNDIAVWN